MKIVGAKVFTENGLFEAKDLYFEGERICDVSDVASQESVIDASGLYAIPGLIDIHFHGAVGHDFCDANLKGLEEIAEYEASCGVLAICPATMTFSEDILGNIMDVAAKYQAFEKSAALVGINMEGPFISPNKVGAQNPKYVMKADAEMVRRLNERSGGLIKLIDIAPEEEGAIDFIKECGADFNISLAHNTSSYEIAKEAFENGAKHITHLYNAMPGINHREPGPIVAAFEESAEVEVIADGIHIHPAMVRFAFQIFGENKVILIADSMEATGLVDGQYQLGGQAVTKIGNKAVLTEHPETIAGSVTNLYDCMKNAVQKMEIPLEWAVMAASQNPAKSIGIEKDYGSLSAGHYANILLVDEDLNLKMIINKGIVIKE